MKEFAEQREVDICSFEKMFRISFYELLPNMAVRVVYAGFSRYDAIEFESYSTLMDF